MKVIIIHCAFKSALNCSGAKNTMIFRRQTRFSPSSFPGFWQYLRHSSTPKCHLHNSESGRVGQDSIPSASILPQKEYKTGEAASATFELHRHSPCRKDGATETKPFTIFFMSNNPADSSRGQVLVHLTEEEALSAECGFLQLGYHIRLADWAPRKAAKEG